MPAFAMARPMADPAVSALLARWGLRDGSARILSAATAAYTQAHRDDAEQLRGGLEARAGRSPISATLSPSTAADQEAFVPARPTSLARAAVALRAHWSEGPCVPGSRPRQARALREWQGEGAALARDRGRGRHGAGARPQRGPRAPRARRVWNREVAGLSGLLRFFATTLYGKLPQDSLEDALDHLRKAATSAPGRHSAPRRARDHAGRGRAPLSGGGEGARARPETCPPAGSPTTTIGPRLAMRSPRCGGSRKARP